MARRQVGCPKLITSPQCVGDALRKRDLRPSPPTGPTTCSPTDIPFGPVNAGIVTQGPCINVQMRLNAEFHTETRSATASPQVLGVMMASQRPNSLAMHAGT